MENDYYLVSLAYMKDYNFVLQEGLWLITHHYLIVQRWRLKFDPYEDNFWKIVIQAHIPGLPIEFYNMHFLWRLGNKTGPTIMVDYNTLRKKENGDDELVERDKFAQICIEIDLRKCFLAKFKLLNRIYRIKYEGLHLICFQCGKYRHKKDMFLEIIQRQLGEAQI